MNKQIIEVYTDGSCSTQHKIGAWACIILSDDGNVTLHGHSNTTTHNRMELMAVIEAIKYVLNRHPNITRMKIYTDSQYVEQIPNRAPKLILNNYETKKGNTIQNVDLVKMLINILDTAQIEFIKVKAHQKSSELINYNREVDKLSRKLVREQVDLVNKG